MVFLAANWDGVTVMMDEERFSVPTVWIAREFPHTAEACASVERRLRTEGMIH